MIKVAVIENENQVYVDLNQIFVENYQDVQIIGYAKTQEEGINLIHSTKPDLVFFNINIINEVEINQNWVDRIPEYKIVFLADDNNQAVLAIKMNCFDYLVKPIKSREVINSIQKFRLQTEVHEKTRTKKVDLHRNQSDVSKPQKIIIPASDQYYLVNPVDIVRLEAGKTHTVVYFSSGKKIMALKNLKSYEEQLSSYGFVRLHNSYIVNILYIKSYIRGVEAKVILLDGIEIPVSRRRKTPLLERLGKV